MGGVPAAALVPLAVAWAVVWAVSLADVARDRALRPAARRAWIAAHLVLWVLTPPVWALVRLRRAVRGGRDTAVP